MRPAIFSVRHPMDEPAAGLGPGDRRGGANICRMTSNSCGKWTGALRKGKLPAQAADEIAAWGRKTDFLRLYQAAWLGPRLQALGVRHVHAHFAGLAARTAFWIERFFGIGFSFHRARERYFCAKTL